MKTIPVYFQVHEPTMMAGAVELPTLGLTVTSGAPEAMNPALGLPFRCGPERIVIDGVEMAVHGEAYHNGPYVEVDAYPEVVIGLLHVIRNRKRRWRVSVGTAAWRERLASFGPIRYADVAPPPVPSERWHRILAEYVRQQRARLDPGNVGTEEYDGVVEGLRILESHVGGPLADLLHTVKRREKARRAMVEEGERWSFGEVRRFAYATRQVFSGAEVSLAAVGGETVSDRARARYQELAAAVDREGGQAA